MKPNFRLALQTIIFGERIEDLDEACSLAASLGFAGIEIFQVPPFLLPLPERFGDLIRAQPDSAQIEAIVERHGLKIVGLAGGSLHTKRQFAAGLRVAPEYLYVDSEVPGETTGWDEKIPLAVHPHLGKAFNDTATAAELLDRYPLLKFIPDTAHLFLANRILADRASTVEMMERYRERIAAVHLKDWSYEYGWSMVSYARGFCPLGQGNVSDLRDVQRWLLERWSGWVVLEQDYARESVERDLAASLEWLFEGHPPARRPRSTRRTGAIPTWVNAKLQASECAGRLSRGSLGELSGFYTEVIRAAGGFFDCLLATLWEVDEAGDTMHLRAWHSESGEAPGVTLLSIRASLSGACVRERFPVFVSDLPALYRSGRFQDARIVERYGARTMLSIPIPNLYNPHSTDFVLNLFPRGDATAMKSAEVLWFVSQVSTAVQHFWCNVRARFFQRFQHRHEAAKNLEKFLKDAAEFARKTLECTEVAIFVTSDDGQRWDLVARDREYPILPTLSTDAGARASLSHRPESIDKRSPDDPVVRACAQRRPATVNPLPDASDPPEVITPIFRADAGGTVLGALRCTGRIRRFRDPSRRWVPPRCFTRSDEMLLDALQAGLASHLASLIDEREKNLAIKGIRHELTIPIKFCRTDLSRFVRFLEERKLVRGKDYTRTLRFREDMQNYLEVMAMVVRRTLHSVTTDQKATGDRQRVKLLAEVVGPVVYLLRSWSKRERVYYDLDKKGGFEIAYLHMSRMPALYVNRTEMLEVCFNLLENAIKYFDRASGRVRIEIEGRPYGAPKLIFRDWGVGIAPEMKEEIFRLGVRERKPVGQAPAKDDGDGIGLWLVRRILAGYGATITVSHCVNPTEFTIIFPPQMLAPDAPAQ